MLRPLHLLPAFPSRIGAAPEPCGLGLVFFGVIILAALLAGCASLVSGPEQEVAVTTDPPGATVQVGDQVLQSPGTVKLPRKNNYTVRVSCEGYYDNYARLRRVENPWILGNILWDLPTTALVLTLTQGMGGDIVGPGSIYDRMTGAGYALAPGKVEVALERRRAAGEPETSASAGFPRNPRVVKEIALPHPALAVHSEGGELWVMQGAKLSRIDPQTNEVAETIARPAGSFYFPEPGALWFLHRPRFGKLSICRRDRQSGQELATIPLPPNALTVRFGEGAIWALLVPHGWGSEHKPLEVHKIDPRTGEVVARIVVDETGGPPKKPFIRETTLTVGLGSVWVTRGAMLARIDAERNTVAATIPLPYEPSAALLGDDALWLFHYDKYGSQSTPDQIARVDPVANRVERPIPYPGQTQCVRVGAGAIWVVNGEASPSTLQAIDPHTGEVAKELLPLGEKHSGFVAPGSSLTIHQGDLWLVKNGSLLRIAVD